MVYNQVPQARQRMLIEFLYNNIITFKMMLRYKQCFIKSSESMKLNKKLQKLLHSLHERTNFQRFLRKGASYFGLKNQKSGFMVTRRLMFKNSPVRQESKKPLSAKRLPTGGMRDLSPSLCLSPSDHRYNSNEEEKDFEETIEECLTPEHIVQTG
mmetsp:Transcript_18773/g.28886  ORF Transcript_18773/g.28886 Transcript_18773/m.28886 type:complete len:155 (-) Transcript_18773:533-997(-)